MAQLLLDGRYRTIKGFQVLIEKDWLSFGHMFARRLGHHNKDFKDDQRSPIFIQFLDLVRMIVVQMPAMFEFNTKLLTYIAYEIYTCKYGTFLCNNQRERVTYKLKEKTVSMWTYINHYSNEFRNPYYIPPQPGQPYMRIPRIPTTNYFDLTVWKDLFLRFCPENPRYNQGVIQGEIFLSEDYRDSLMREQRELNLTLTELLQKSKALIEKLANSEEMLA